VIHCRHANWPAPTGKPVDLLEVWYQLYGTEAESEGWALFEPLASNHAPIEIQYLQDGDVFAFNEEEGDYGAWKWVVDSAVRGSECHQAALRVLFYESREEFDAIVDNLLLGRSQA
jgi:hypothetical protein